MNLLSLFKSIIKRMCLHVSVRRGRGGGKEGCEEGIVCQESTYGGMLPTETEVKMYKMLSRKFHYVMQDHCWN